MSLVYMVPSPIIDAALAILADGKAHTADEILSQGLKQKLFDAGMTRKRVYTALSQYVERARGRGRKPQLLEDAQHRFRLNHTLDDWPDLDTTGLPPLGRPPEMSGAAQAALEQLLSASGGADPTAFEVATCAAFAQLGFAATHVGGNGAPDGYADALLGPLTYRVMIECKLSADVGNTHTASAAEAAKFKAAFHGDVCALVAPTYEGEVTFADELQAHGVSAWTVDDLATALKSGYGALELRRIFAPGFAQDSLEDLSWEGVHGRPKRLRVIASVIIREAMRQQSLDQQLDNRQQAPRFGLDVAMSVVDACLGASGAFMGCCREDVQAAFEWLTSPYVNRAVWIDDTKTSIVVA